MRRLLVLVAVLPLLLTGSALADVAAGPPRLQLSERCVTKSERRKAIRFLAADSTRLIGLELGSGRRGLLLAHGHHQNVCEWIRHGRRYARSGYRVLLFDHRNHGSSTYTKRRYWRVDHDVVGAVRTLRKRGARTVIVAGSSMGATAALVGAAAAQPPVDGVVSLSAPTNISSVNAQAAVQRLAVPTLFVAAEQDDPFNADAQTLFNASVAREKQLEVLPGSAAHGSGLLASASIRTLFDEFLRVHSD